MSRGALTVSIMFSTNDSNIHYYARNEEAYLVMNMFAIFEKALEQKINNKSNVFFSRKVQEETKKKS